MLYVRVTTTVQARLWRLILAQSTDGSWGPSSTTAFALEARALKEIKDLKMTFVEQLKDRFANLSEAMDQMDDEDVEDALEGGAAQQVGGVTAEPATGAPRNMPLSRSSSTRPGVSAEPEDDEVADDPLFCSAAAITASMPGRLSRLAAADGVDTGHVWTTMCCIALLETLNVSYLWTDGELYPAIERTMVDAAREWVEARAAETPSLAAALEDGALAKAATRAMTLWHRAWERRVNDLRRADAITAHHTASFVHRSGTELMRAVCTKHSTFAVFLSAPLEGMQVCGPACVCVRVCVITDRQRRVRIFRMCSAGRPL
jgi:hypothetical protein